MLLGYLTIIAIVTGLALSAWNGDWGAFFLILGIYVTFGVDRRSCGWRSVLLWPLAPKKERL